MKNKKNKLVADINITPFTDVVLVLLIIFMITTPMLSQHGIKVNLPKAENTEQDDKKNIEVLIDKDGVIYLDGLQLHSKYFEEAIKSIIAKHPERAVVVKGDKDIKYDLVVKVMDQAKKAGATKFALAVETSAKKRGK
ncbi:MAG: biopolymer transporter ExbD [Endomicrobiia bacterium]|nr:biopolymer transporter ExbD [Endomicrobiaceae bacterium]MDD3053230.1 biopolymer transporter ExbD [Endomicrobiaceae bacterium]MDD3922515.1 biopolymer transporter ExbD [Endomicrobiaceae bacterium]